MRGIYSVGVLDCCMDHGTPFDLTIGISAGNTNLASFTAVQRGQNHQFYTQYAFRKQYMSIRNFIFKKSFKPYEVKNIPYFDGALGDPVPAFKVKSVIRMHDDNRIQP